MPSEDIPRFVPDRALPPYSYVSGYFPHPIRDENGHMADTEIEPTEALDPDCWRENETYLYGIDLFNHGYYWEAHEAWETLWLGLGRHGALADFLKGLIKLAAAGVKVREGRTAGVQRHMGRAVTLLESAMQRQPHESERLLGLDVKRLIENAQEITRCPPVLGDSGLRPVNIVFSFQLLPE